MDKLELTAYQVTFTVFFAIAWGAMANIQPRWKPFEAALNEIQTGKRWWLSFRWFNVAPILYYLAVMAFLFLPVFQVPSGLGTLVRIPVTLLGLGACAVAAGAVFGFYRCWLGTVEQAPEVYYFRGDDGVYYTHPEKGGKKIGFLNPSYGRRNWSSGLLYMAVAALALPVTAGVTCLVVRLLR